MNNSQLDYIIVGQGIAGTFFSHELSKSQHSFVVIDSGAHNASKTAAGMYNPIILKRFSLVWQAQEQIDTARRVVSELERLLDIQCDYPLAIQRIFHDAQEQQTWQKKASDATLGRFLQQEIVANTNQHIVAPFGLGNVQSGGRVDLPTLLAAYRQHLQANNQLLEEDFNHQELTIHNDGVSYRGIKAKKIVFCEGYGIKRNPFFNHLPLNGNKGEVLTVRIANLDVDTAIKSSVFIMPLPEHGTDIYFVGSTYNWTDKDSIPSAEGRRQLLQKLAKFVDGDIEVLEHRAGIRPTVADRRPLLGQHPAHQPLYIMNGLGTRGVMLGATMAVWLYEHITRGTPLPSEVDCRRFNAKPEK